MRAMGLGIIDQHAKIPTARRDGASLGGNRQMEVSLSRILNLMLYFYDINGYIA